MTGMASRSCVTADATAGFRHRNVRRLETSLGSWSCARRPRHVRREPRKTATKQQWPTVGWAKRRPLRSGCGSVAVDALLIDGSCYRTGLVVAGGTVSPSRLSTPHPTSYFFVKSARTATSVSACSRDDSRSCGDRQTARCSTFDPCHYGRSRLANLVDCTSVAGVALACQSRLPSVRLHSCYSRRRTNGADAS